VDRSGIEKGSLETGGVTQTKSRKKEGLYLLLTAGSCQVDSRGATGKKRVSSHCVVGGRSRLDRTDSLTQGAIKGMQQSKRAKEEGHKNKGAKEPQIGQRGSGSGITEAEKESPVLGEVHMLHKNRSHS